MLSVQRHLGFSSDSLAPHPGIAKAMSTEIPNTAAVPNQCMSVA